MGKQVEGEAILANARYRKASLYRHIISLTRIKGRVQSVHYCAFNELLFGRRGCNVKVERKHSELGSRFKQGAESYKKFRLRQVLKRILNVTNSVLRRSN